MIDAYSPLTLEPLQRLVTAFGDAAEKFGFLGHVAAWHWSPEWPLTPHGPYQHFGLPHCEWKQVIGEYSRSVARTIVSRRMWMKLEGKLWEGAFLDDTPDLSPLPRRAVRRTIAQHNRRLKEAIAEFDRLGEKAAAAFDLTDIVEHVPLAESMVERPRVPEGSHRWLEAVYQTSLARPELVGGLEVRRLSTNVFQASAYAIPLVVELAAERRDQRKLRVAGHASSDEPRVPEMLHPPATDRMLDPEPVAGAAPSGRREARPEDPIEDVLSVQPLLLYRLLKVRVHYTMFDTLRNQEELWRNPNPGDATITRGLKRLRKCLNEIAAAPHLEIDSRTKRTRLMTAAGT